MDMVDPGNRVTLDLELTTDLAGGVIGKGGSKINGIRSKTGCTVKIQTAEIEGFRSAIITGTRDQIASCIDSVFDENNLSAGEAETSIRLLVPAPSIGAVIGRKGESITRIRRDSGANVRVHDRCGSTEDARIVELSGEIRCIGDALSLIVDRLDEDGKLPTVDSHAPPPAPPPPPAPEPPRTRGWKGPPPRGRGRATAPIGGFAVNIWGAPPPPAPARAPALARAAEAHWGITGRSEGTRGDRGNSGYAHEPPRNVGRGKGQVGNSHGDRGFTAKRELPPPPATTWQDQQRPVIVFEIANDLAGAIIGKGGSVITSIRKATHAKIELKEGAPGMRLVSIDGVEDEVDHCISEVIQKMENDPKFCELPEDEQVIEVVVVVPPFQIGAVIGKGGANIQAVRDNSGCQVKVDQVKGTPPDTDRAVLLGGAPERVSVALRMVARTLFEQGKVPSVIEDTYPKRRRME